MKPLSFEGHPEVSVDPVLGDALARSIQACSSEFRHLPVPVRFRASGALRAWRPFVDSDFAASAKAALADPACPLGEARHALARQIDPRIRVREFLAASFGPLLNTLERFCSPTLAFWMRNGAIYEPTLPLGALLGGTDIAQDLPLELLAPPAPALCIVPHWQQRHLCADAHSVLVFEHAAGPTQSPARRALTFVAYQPIPGGVDACELTLPVNDEQDTLPQALQRAVEGTSYGLGSGYADAGDLQKSQRRWQQMLDYVTKVLLYLRTHTAQVRAHSPYSSAPKEFPGLGRRKREAKLAEVQRLYDRYITGPESFADMGVDAKGARQLTGHELPAHWRRGHFRLQPHGPHSSLRKVMFIAPTVVRADRLSAVA
jgi:hypothetical protein